jgi:hypothetical protein
MLRFLLAFSVSLWMAGGCVFGCSNTTAMAAESEHEAQTVAAVSSCHAKHAKQQPQGVASFAPAPREMMKDCPLVVNATAVTAKNSDHLPGPGRVSVAALPLVENTTRHSNISYVCEYLPNRGPTHLRCCVFLI